MKNRNFCIAVVSVIVAINCLIWASLWTVMCLDYKEQTEQLRQEIIDYKWQLEQVDQMICINGEDKNNG